MSVSDARSERVRRRHCRIATLAVHCRHRRGRRRGLEPGGARTDRRGRDRVRRQASSGAGGAADPRRGTAMAEPVRRRRGRGAAASRPPGLRARLRRSVPIRRRRRTGAPYRCPRDGRRSGAVGVQPCRGAARLVAAADRAALAARPRARSDPPASATRRAHSRSDLRWRRTGGAWRSCWRDRLRRIAADGARSARRSARAHPRHDGSGIRSRRRSTRSTLSRSRWRRRRMRACWRARRDLPDDLFEHDGQITKREIRAVTLSSLAPRRGELLWDIGAGSGSVAIEWLLADPAMRAIAIERRAGSRGAHPPQCRGLRRARPRVVEGAAPAALAGLADARRCLHRRRRAMPACSTPRRARCGPAAGSWSMR